MTSWLAIQPWNDKAVTSNGYDARSAYAELFWLPTIGPTSLLLLRHLAHELERHPEGIHLSIAETAQRLGIGNREGSQSPIRRCIARLTQFDLAHHDGGAAYRVRTTLPRIPARHYSRLPDTVRAALTRWHEPVETYAALQARARRSAAVLAAEGASMLQIERTLGAMGIHPAVCFSAAQWATAQPDLAHVS
ncbi:MAG: hypothetical protein ACOYN3_05765 [Acidimicrobiia bacterium]